MNHRNFKFPPVFESLLFDNSLQRFPPGDEWQRMLDVLHMAPGLDSVIEVYEYEIDGQITSDQAYYIRGMIAGLVDIFLKSAIDGDELAELQLIAAQKMISPESFNLERTDVEAVANRDSSYGGNFAARARGYAIRRWMSWLSFVLEPKKSGQPMEPKTPVRMRPREKCIRQDYYDLADELCRRYTKPTLQLLAIRAFQLELEESGARVPEPEELRRDLGLVAQFDDRYSEDSKFWTLTPVFGGKALIINIMADPWMKRG